MTIDNEELLNEQYQYWKNLCNELSAYKKKYGVTNTEIANGLSISRQRLYDYYKNYESGLPIQRVNLKNLWELICNPSERVSKKLQDEELKNRKKLKELGCNDLLEKAGFLPDKNLENSIILDKINDPPSVRLNAHLKSIKNERERALTSNYFLDLINDRCRLESSHDMKIIYEINKVKQIPRLELSYDQSSDPALEKYDQEIDKFLNSGKLNYLTSELHELYHSINEHVILNRHMPNHITILNCEFRNISNSINDILKVNHDEGIADIFKNSGKNLLRYLRGEEDDKYNVKRDDLSNDEINISYQEILHPVIEVAISCNLSYEKEEHPNIIWRCSSTDSHSRNMFRAVKNGLGYPFEILNASCRNLGSLEKSLIRSEVMIIDPEAPDKVYQGWWVDINDITGNLRAVMDGIKRWLSDQKDINPSSYYRAFQKLAEIDEQLFISRASFYSQKPHLNHTILDDCDKEIEIAQNMITDQNKENKYFKDYLCILDRKRWLASLTKMHIYLLEGDVSNASELCKVAEAILFSVTDNENEKESKDSGDNILFINASSCIMFYKLLAGERDFIENKHWRDDGIDGARFNIHKNMGKVRKYIQDNNYIDIDTYLYTSQFLGTIGYLEFYVANENEDIEHLENAINYLLDAANYALRIGHIKRAIHWIAYISRIYCRLNNDIDADKYLRLAINIGQKSASMNQLGDVEPLMFYPALSRKVFSALEADNSMLPNELGNSLSWSMSNFNLAKGELYLIKKDFDKAEECFFQSLINSISTGFSRLAADSIFNLFRLSQNHEIKSINRFYQEVSPKVLSRNTFNKSLAAFIKRIESQKSESNLSEELKKYSQEIWNSWSSVKAINTHQSSKHILSEKINSGDFLKILD